MINTLYDLQCLNTIDYRYHQVTTLHGIGTDYRETAKVIDVSDVREFEYDGKRCGIVDMVVEFPNGKTIKVVWRGYGENLEFGSCGKPNPFKTILGIS